MGVAVAGSYGWGGGQIGAVFCALASTMSLWVIGLTPLGWRPSVPLLEFIVDLEIQSP